MGVVDIQAQLLGKVILAAHGILHLRLLLHQTGVNLALIVL